MRTMPPTKEERIDVSLKDKELIELMSEAYTRNDSWLRLVIARVQASDPMIDYLNSMVTNNINVVKSHPRINMTGTERRR